MTWQDADDLSRSDRLQQQVDFLNGHEEFGAVGTGITRIDAGGRSLGDESFPQDPDHHRIDPELACPSVMSRREAASHAGLMRHDGGEGADGDWLLRMAERYAITNIDPPLYMYRQHGTSIMGSRGAVCFRFRMLARYAARMRRAGRADPLDALIDDRVFQVPGDDFFCEHLEIKPDEKVQALRFPYGDQPPLVSVLIAYYNGERYFRACLESLAAQSHRNFEIVVHDDGSACPLSRQAIIDVVGDQIPVSLVRSEKNQGLGVVCNHLISRARGRFWLWQDADDLSHPHRIETLLLHLFARPQCVAVGSGYISLDEDTGEEKEVIFANRNAFIGGVCYAAASATLMMRGDIARKIGGYRPELNRYFEDVEFLARLTSHGSVENISGAFYTYRQHSRQIMAGSRHEELYRITCYFLSVYGLRPVYIHERPEQKEALDLAVKTLSLLNYLKHLNNRKNRVGRIFRKLTSNSSKNIEYDIISQKLTGYGICIDDQFLDKIEEFRNLTIFNNFCVNHICLLMFSIYKNKKQIENFLDDYKALGSKKIYQDYTLFLDQRKKMELEGPGPHRTSPGVGLIF